jgi:hypothetical protein
VKRQELTAGIVLLMLGLFSTAFRAQVLVGCVLLSSSVQRCTP